MAHFCEYCGAPLEDGQECGCEQAAASRNCEPAPAAEPVPAAEPAAVPAAEAAGEPAPTEEPVPAAEAESAAQVQPTASKPVRKPIRLRLPDFENSAVLHDLTAVVLSYLLHPKKGVRAGVTCGSNFQILGILLGCNALMAFFYLWSLAARAANAASAGVNAVIGILGASVAPSTPIGKLLLSAIVLTAVCWALSALALFGCAKINKGRLTILQSLCVASTNTLFHTVLLLLGILLGFLSWKVQLVCLIASVVVWALVGIADLRDYTGMAPTASIRNLAIETAIVLAVVLVCGFLGWKLTAWCVSDMFASLTAGLGI